MGLYYFDASAAVKRYALEAGTTWIRTLADPKQGHFFYLSRISEVEIIAALARKRRDGSLSPAGAAAAMAQFRMDWTQDYRIVEVTAGLITQASHLADTHNLRAYDAVQLAAALAIQAVEPSLVLVSADRDLNAAGSAEGLPVDDPNTYP